MKPLLSLPLLLLIACTPAADTHAPAAAEPATQTATAPTAGTDSLYDVDLHFAAAERDSLLVDLITRIHRKPSAAINRDRTDLRFRSYYSAQLPEYTFLHHLHADDGTHWFYLARPARSVKGDRRGVGGRYTMGADGRLERFEEIFNTPVLPMDSIRTVGTILFPGMIALNGGVPHANDRGLVEWPDDRLHYDKVLQEWRAVDAPKVP